MTTFDERERGEETKYKHDLELGFKIRNRRNKLFGLWVAQSSSGSSGDAATAYAKEVVMADFELPGDSDMIDKVKVDLAKRRQVAQRPCAREAAGGARGRGPQAGDGRVSDAPAQRRPGRRAAARSPRRRRSRGPEQPAGEVNGPPGPEPTRFGDWEKGGRCSDF